MAAQAPGGVLALDLALSTGWCYGVVGAEQPLAGTWLLRDPDAPISTADDVGEPCLALDNELHDAIRRYRPGLVIMEAPLRHVSHRLLLGLAAHVESCCARNDRLPCEEAEVNHVRLNVLGRYRFPKGQVKFHVRRWCEWRGWQVGTLDEADARVLWQFKCDQLLAQRAATAA